jgi:hypothetical protein
MAKGKKKALENAEKKIGGPFLAAAFFCENILEDMKGMLSVQGITDAVQIAIHPHAPPDVPSEEKPLVINQQVLLMFRSGDSPGKHHLKIETEGPSRKRETIKDDEVTLSDLPNGGLNIKIAIGISVTRSVGGLFLIDVILDGVLMTRVPLNIAIIRPELPAEAMPKKSETTTKKNA